MSRVAVFSNMDGEVLVFSVNKKGKASKSEMAQYFFEGSGRDMDDYDIEIVPLPIQVKPAINWWC